MEELLTYATSCIFAPTAPSTTGKCCHKYNVVSPTFAIFERIRRSNTQNGKHLKTFRIRLYIIYILSQKRKEIADPGYWKQTLFYLPLITNNNFQGDNLLIEE